MAPMPKTSMAEIVVAKRLGRILGGILLAFVIADDRGRRPRFWRG